MHEMRMKKLINFLKNLIVFLNDFKRIVLNKPYQKVRLLFLHIFSRFITHRKYEFLVEKL